jgi:uncharacterized protein YecE (DUF72 family)
MTYATPALPLYLGCPVWNSDHWHGQVFPEGTKRPQWLSWYTRMFNCVEGNSSFYSIPRPEHVLRWGQEAAKGFRFCFKFPREISHERSLERAGEPTRQFLSVVEMLGQAERLGPTFLQLGPGFAADRFESLSKYLRGLPREFPWAVEVRHASWFDGGEHEQRLDELLLDLKIDRVIFDSRPLYHLPPEDEVERESQRRKPKSPLRKTVTGQMPMLRLIGRNRIELVDPFLDEWIPTLVEWMERGLKPVVFTHAPDDAFAPALARRLWDRLRVHLPGNQPALPLPPAKPRQLELL